jgi:integrase
MLQREQVPMVMDALQGDIMLPIAACALYAGLRRGETLALRWNAIDLEAGKLAVVASLEELVNGTLTFKAPKTKAGRRLIAMPDKLITILRAHRLEQLEFRLKLGIGKMPDDALLFAHPDGSPLSPRALSLRWGRFAGNHGIGDVRLVSRSAPHPGQPAARCRCAAGGREQTPRPQQDQHDLEPLHPRVRGSRRSGRSSVEPQPQRWQIGLRWQSGGNFPALAGA